MACGMVKRGEFNRPGARICTPVHRFAQRFDPNLIDAVSGKHYLPRQIEPKALELYGSVQRAQQLNGGCVARLNR